MKKFVVWFVIGTPALCAAAVAGGVFLRRRSEKLRALYADYEG